MSENEAQALPIIFAHRVGCGCEGWRCAECWRPLEKREQIISIGTTRYCLDCIRYLVMAAHGYRAIAVANQKD